MNTKHLVQSCIFFFFWAVGETNGKRTDFVFRWFLSATLIWFWKHYILLLPLEFPNKWNYADFVRPGPFSMWLYLTHFYIWKSFPDKKQKFPDLSAASHHQTFSNETKLRNKVNNVCKYSNNVLLQYQMTSPQRPREN